MTKTFSLNELISFARSQHQHDELAPLLGYIPEFVELLSAKFCHDLVAANKENKNELAYLNFWKVQWRHDDKHDNDFYHLKSSFVATSAARKLTKKFNESENTITKEIEDYFHQLLTRPPTYLPLLQTITQMAQTNGELYPKEMRVGTNIAYLFKITFSSLLKLTFEEGGALTLPGIGTFERKFKIKPKQISKETEGGVLQFSPNPSVC